MIFCASGYTQRVRLDPYVLDRVDRHRQTSSEATEAGGQLFGNITAELIDVTTATGPYKGDERTRFSHRSNPGAAQRAVEVQSAAGRLYLGEWHTHAEHRPVASGADRDAIERLIGSSTTNTNSLLMLIVGRAEGSDGLALLTVSSRADFTVWCLAAAAACPPRVVLAETETP